MSPLLALSGQSSRALVCPLLDQSGQSWILARDGLSAYDPERTLRGRLSCYATSCAGSEPEINCKTALAGAASLNRKPCAWGAPCRKAASACALVSTPSTRTRRSRPLQRPIIARIKTSLSVLV